MGSEFWVLVIFISSSIFLFLVFVGKHKSVIVKLHGKKKKEIGGSFNGVLTMCRLGMAFFFSQFGNNRCVSCYVMQSKTALS